MQLHRLDLVSGDSVQLTRAKSEKNGWIPWNSPSGRGVLDHRSVLNVLRNEVIYCDGNTVRCVGIEDGRDRILFEIPGDRELIAQNCVSDDGSKFVYIHADPAIYRSIHEDYGHKRDSFRRSFARRNQCHGTVLAWYDSTRESSRGASNYKSNPLCFSLQ